MKATVTIKGKTTIDFSKLLMGNFEMHDTIKSYYVSSDSLVMLVDIPFFNYLRALYHSFLFNRTPGEGTRFEGNSLKIRRGWHLE